MRFSIGFSYDSYRKDGLSHSLSSQIETLIMGMDCRTCDTKYADKLSWQKIGYIFPPKACQIMFMSTREIFSFEVCTNPISIRKSESDISLPNIHHEIIFVLGIYCDNMESQWTKLVRNQLSQSMITSRKKSYLFSNNAYAALPNQIFRHPVVCRKCLLDEKFFFNI